MESTSYNAPANYNAPVNNAYYQTNRPPKKMKTSTIVIIVVSALVLFALIITAVAGLIFFGVTSAIKNSGSYQTAIAYIENSPEVIAEVGEIEGYGFMPSGGSSTTNGYGDADWVITVNGSKKTIRVHIKLEKAPLTDWEVTYFDYR